MPPKKLYRPKNRHYTASIIPPHFTIPPPLCRPHPKLKLNLIKIKLEN